MFLFPTHVPIPELFHSAETSAPIEACLMCERTLLDTGAEYLVEKAVRQHPDYSVREVIVEYALCMSCHASLHDTISDASKAALETFFLENTDLHQRAIDLFSTEVDPDEPDLTPWLDGCVVHGTPTADLHEYQVIGQCVGRDLLLTHMPLVIGGPAMDAVMQQLSNETLDELGGFRDEHFGLPPEFSRDLRGPILA